MYHRYRFSRFFSRCLCESLPSNLKKNPSSFPRVDWKILQDQNCSILYCFLRWKKRLKCVLALVIVQCLAVFFRDVLGSVVNLFPCPSWVVAQRYYEWFAGDSMGNRSTLFLHKRKRLPWCLFVTWLLNVHCLSYQCHCSSCPEPNTGGYLKLYLTPSASYWINFIYSSRYKAYCSF